MKTSVISKIATITTASALILGLSACSGDSQEAEAAPKVGTSAEAAKVIEEFVAATTSDEIAAALPKDAEGDAYSKSLEFVSVEDSDTEVLSEVLWEFALLKVSNPKSKFAVAVDPEKISVDADKATVHADAVTVNSDGKALPNSKELAANFTTLEYSDDTWHLVFAAPEATPTATPSASATATESAKPKASPTASPSASETAKK